MPAFGLWIGGIVLFCFFWFVMWTFPRSFGALVIGILLIVFRHSIFPWLGITIWLESTHERSVAFFAFWLFYLIAFIVSCILDYVRIQYNGWWWDKGC